jgi:anaerobic ribonucleoside-triphosphate reductase activating protein
MLRYAKIKKMDIDNAPGICVSLFVQGCSHHCKGCFNPETWDPNGGMIFNRRVEMQFLDLCKGSHIKNICILGGEPMDQPEEVLALLKKIKEVAPDKGIWIWSGYTYEDILKSNEPVDEIRREILTVADVLVDGRFIEELADKRLRYCGSSNQRVIDLRNNKTIS